ncbi:hypothetical protein BTJ49_03885 [Oleiagrimonas sp. MCCC 1A03011]|nr:hypothetical protein BTJ49_03885 [Oleiagrimonas sp. MCCC 1A03011]
MVHDRMKEPLRRSGSWYLKWLLASYAASYALFLFMVVTSLPFCGYRFSNWWFTPIGGNVQLGVAMLVSPFVYKRLR